MFSSKSTFAGGETYLQIDSDTMDRRFDEGTGETVGIYRIELEISEDEDSYCFRYTLDQHNMRKLANAICGRH